MTLLPGFTEPVHQSQRAFRLILKALSEPGAEVTLSGNDAWDQLGRAATAVLLTLADGETPLYLCQALDGDTLLNSLRFHTGAPLAERPQAACLALLDSRLSAAQLQALPYGSEISPELGATVLVQIDSLSGGAPLRLSGPGIEHQRRVAPVLPAPLLAYLLDRPQRFPLGLDFLLACDDGLMAIPRTTHVEVC
ncbi:phosphonate C-P lyase system protein PhnH [Acerihabitans arboris]|uniref:Phosphonate C-P lyase system protein PhnH n=1 Tax=Acerihabitans arboris TaxID=2691583 RepID=A0A845SG12_9GAMM|nr:phosphonate C-P lyase system protein PhnH [Acerihabitans arboris]NDL63790.1 phosphonate C-P lyase system protein PhnH [Acerihabitans arboris]